MAVGLPQRCPGVWRKLGWLSWSSELIPFLLPSVVTQPYGTQPQFHPSHCQSWSPSCLTLFNISPLCFLFFLSFLSLHDHWPVPDYSWGNWAGEEGRRTSGFPMYNEIGSCALSIQNETPRASWEEGDGASAVTFFPLPSRPDLAAFPPSSLLLLDSSRKLQGEVLNPLGN